MRVAQWWRCCSPFPVPTRSRLRRRCPGCGARRYASQTTLRSVLFSQSSAAAWGGRGWGGSCAALKRMRLEQAAHARAVRALQKRLVEVEKERVEERAARHSTGYSELRASIKEALAKVSSARDALSPRSWRRCGARVRSSFFFITAGPITKLFAWGGGEGYCVKEGGGGEGEREKERTLGFLSAEEKNLHTRTLTSATRTFVTTEVFFCFAKTSTFYSVVREIETTVFGPASVFLSTHW